MHISQSVFCLGQTHAKAASVVSAAVCTLFMCRRVLCKCCLGTCPFRQGCDHSESFSFGYCMPFTLLCVLLRCKFCVYALCSVDHHCLLKPWSQPCTLIYYWPAACRHLLRLLQSTLQTRLGRHPFCSDNHTLQRSVDSAIMHLGLHLWCVVLWGVLCMYGSFGCFCGSVGPRVSTVLTKCACWACWERGG